MQRMLARHRLKKSICPFSPLISFPLAILLLVFLFVSSGCSKGPQGPPPLPAVEVMTVIQKDVPIHHEWVGTMDGMVNATIRAQVQGYLIRQNYREGDLVKKGQVLFEIDPRTFQTTLDQAKGQLEAQQARWTTAKANLARIKPLAEQNAVSKKDLDDSIGTEHSARASVISAQAAVDRAKLELAFTRITSPVDGIAGLAKAQIGNLVGPGGTQELTTVSTVNPIKVYIQISEQEYLQAGRHAGRHVAHKVAMPQAELILADGSLFPQKGSFAFADRQVDVKTGTIRVAVIFPNPVNFLRPGQYGKIRMITSVKKDALLVPQRAVIDMQGKYFVAVVGSDNKVDIRPVKTAQRVENLWIIEGGLKPGETVIVEGIMKVKPGMAVVPKPFVAGSAAGAVGQGAVPTTKPEEKTEQKQKAPPTPARADQTEKR